MKTRVYNVQIYIHILYTVQSLTRNCKLTVGLHNLITRSQLNHSLTFQKILCCSSFKVNIWGVWIEFYTNLLWTVYYWLLLRQSSAKQKKSSLLEGSGQEYAIHVFSVWLKLYYLLQTKLNGWKQHYPEVKIVFHEKYLFLFRIAVFCRRSDAANVCLIFNGNNQPGFKGPGYHIQVNLKIIFWNRNSKVHN